jgi:futalosine hydrolase
MPTDRILIVTAVEAELDAARARLEPVVRDRVAGVAAGVGPVAAAIATARALAGDSYALVVSAGIAGGFAGKAEIGDIVIGRTSTWADLGALTEEGFLDLPSLGLPGGADLRSPAAEQAAAALTAAGVDTRVGAILTLATMTGTQHRATELARRHPSALAEAMEGYGIAAAAEAAGVDWVEVRTISNLIGRRDRSNWDIPAAFNALGTAIAVTISS